MKKVLSLLAIVLAIVGCGQDNKKDTPETYTINITHSNAPGEPNDISANKWADIINEKGKGKIKAVVYPASQLGSQKDVMEQILLGANIVSISDAGFLMDYVPSIGILYAPYISDSYEEYFKLIDSPWFAQQKAEVAEKGFEIVTAKWIYGTRHILTSKPINTPADLKGLKIRTPNINILVKTIEYMGGTPTPMALSEVYPGLSQKVIDGVENPISVLYGGKFHEQVKYLSLTGHIQNVSMWIGSSKFFEKLPVDLAKIVVDAGEEAAQFQAELVKKADAEYLAKMKQEGVTIVKSDVESFKKAVQPLYSELFSEEVIKEVLGSSTKEQL